MSKVRVALGRMWHWYRIACTIFFTGAALYVFNSLVEDRYRYVQLPNGTRLVATKWLEGGIALENSHGDFIVQPDIGGVVWNSGYVKGWRSTAPLGRPNRPYGKDDIFFIYKVGAATAIERNDVTEKQYIVLEKQSGLTDRTEVAPGKFESGYKDQFSLIWNAKYRRMWYE